MTYSKSSTIFFTSRTTIIVILSILLAFIAMNTERIDHPQSSISTRKNTESANEQSFFSQLFHAIQKLNKQVDTNKLSIILADLKPSIPFSDLNFRLHGVVYKGDNSSYALISQHGGVQEVYQIKSMIYQRAIVEEITRNQVVVNYYGEKHVLEMGGYGSQTKVQYLNEIFNDVKGADEDIFQQRVMLEQDKRRNPIRLLMIRRPYAVYEQGQFLGYKIMPGGNADQFIRLGFQSGDILTSLNGQTFEGPGMQQFIINELTHSRNIDLVVVRDQDTLSIIYGF
ncbi:type II secretion system protein N [uncultured Cocleimonas sp.]|uniref:type II secretion system protein N n=1 Tax=uncultured Cocleimonas sp. TaxID=1051587 RepID=UPI002636B3F8|nr:type II secretion system protein N [uncultured Cocleimonas sp.]